MSEDENCEFNKRFNKFECSSGNLEKRQLCDQNSSLRKPSNSNEKICDTRATKNCLPDNMGSLNKSWSEHSVNVSEVSPVIKFSVNNRLKKLKESLVTSESYAASTENLSEPATSILLQNHKEYEIESKQISMDNKCSSETLSTPIVNTSSDQLTSPIGFSTPVNIYKNLHKWVPNSDKSLKRNFDESLIKNLASRRYLSLRRFINSSSKDTTKSNSGEISHNSPLLLGLKTSSVDECMPDYSTPKEVALDTKLNTSKQSRSMRLVQSALCKENFNNEKKNLQNNKSLLETPVSSKRKVSDMLGNITEISQSESKRIKKYCIDNNNTKQHIEESTKFSLCDSHNKPSTSSEPELQTDDNFQEKMKMTSNWIENHCLIDNKNCNIFSDKPQIENVTIDNSHNEKKENCNTDEMEWTNAEPDESTTKVTEDKPVINADLHRESNEINDNAKIEETDVDPEESDKPKTLCIVVDTNIFIDNLSKLKDILEVKTEGLNQIILYIPWMVITELDFLKDSQNINERRKKIVCDSIKFINTLLTERSEKIVAQTVFDMQHQKQLGTSPDDKILACCLFVKEKYESVILLSNDLNLKNKALIHNVEAYSPIEIIMKIMGKLRSNLKYMKIQRKMGNLCSTIICGCAKETYEDIWEKMGIFSNAPWSLVECLKRFKKCWVAIFKNKLLKHFMKAVEEILAWSEENKYITDDSKEYVQFMKYCITLCIYLRDIEQYNSIVQNTLSEITKIG